MSLFDKYYPSGHFKRLFKQAFGEKVIKLDQDKEMAICLSKDKSVASSFMINKSKRKTKEDSSPVVNTPKKRQPTVSGAASKVPGKKAKREKSPEPDNASNSSSNSDSEEDLEEKLRKAPRLVSPSLNWIELSRVTTTRSSI